MVGSSGLSQQMVLHAPSREELELMVGSRASSRHMRAIRGLTTAAALLSVACMPPEWGANGLLHPTRRRLVATPDLPHEDVAFRSDGLLLKGWLFHANGARRGLIVHLHGVADNRSSGVGIAQRFGPKGYDVLTYDSRAHGESEGEDCTYGFYVKRDLSRALDAIHAEEVVLFGSSLGAAVALQAAAEDPRVRGVIAQSPFSDLETIARERARGWRPRPRSRKPSRSRRGTGISGSPRCRRVWPPRGSTSPFCSSTARRIARPPP